MSSFYDGSSDKVKLAVGAMVIKLRDMVVAKDKVNNKMPLAAL